MTIKFTRLLFAVMLVLACQTLNAQTTITQWNFNSNPPDAATATGSTITSLGMGTITAVGGTTTSFASGTSNGGSSDPATADNSGWNLTNFPAVSANDKTAGFQVAVSTAGYQNIVLTFDHRHSNTGSKYLQLQYTTDVTAVPVIWNDFVIDSALAGDTWYQRSFNLTSVTGLNNNPNAAFRAVSTFAPSTSSYSASGSTSTYGTGGTWRFDMVTIKGTSTLAGDTTAPVAQVYQTTSNTTSFIKFSEKLNATSAANVTNYVFASALTINNASLGLNGDTVFLTHAPIVDGQAYTLTVSGVQDTSLNTMASTNFNILFNSSTPNLVITEFAHSPNTMEFIEVYNAGATAVNLGGLKWTDGTTGDFPVMTLAAGATILFSTNTTSSAALMGGTSYGINNGLGSSNDQLVIRNSLNQLIDSVDYFVGTNSWPSAPASVYGYSFELNSAASNNNAGSNWAVPQNIISSSNGTILATPGAYPPPAPNPAPQVTSFKQLSTTSTYLVFNQVVTNASATTTANYSFAPSLAVSAAVRGVVGDTVFLTHAALTDGTAYTLTVSGVTNSSNVANTTANLSLIWNQSVPNLVITEIIHSPNDVESIEIYNAGATAVNLGGLKWTDGTTGNFPVVTLAAGGTAVFATAPATASSTLGVPTVYTINNGLGSSNDLLIIRNSLDQVIDSVEYFVGTNGWPTAPTGVYAYSFELTSASANNAIGSNWVVPFNTVTPQPSLGVIRATPGVYPPPIVTPPSASVNFVGTRTNVSETTSTVNIVVNLTGGNASPSLVDLQLVGFGTATSGTDFTLPATMQFNWAANSNNVNDTITINITNDALPEGAEYFVVRLTNAVNATLPAASANNFLVYILDDDKFAPTASQQISLTHLTSYSNGASGSNSAEIVVHDPQSQKLFIANSIAGKIDIVHFNNPLAPSLDTSLSMAAFGNINSIAVRNGVIAAAIEDGSNPQANGKIVFFDTAGIYISQVTAGAMPDMITFNNAGTKVLTANEGEPNTNYTSDPEGSITIVDISGGVASVTQSNVSTATFTSFNAQVATLKASGVRIFGPGASVAQDMEPEYIAMAPNDATAYVTCQENNAVAVVDIATATVTSIYPLGTKNHALAGNALDANDQGGVIQIANYPIKGMYLPDALATFSANGQTYFVTANEGDVREWNAYEEAVRLSDVNYTLDPTVFPNATALKAAIGRLTVTTASGDIDNDGDFDEIHAFGSRSFSIWNASTGALVYDSGDDFEMITSQHPTYSAVFNASNSNNTLKNRSDDKGPEPEGVTTATINGNQYAFIALERTGGVMVYDITNPASATFVDYKNTRNLASFGGDNGAEGIIFISAANSPNTQPLVLLANEVSSTITVYQVNATPLNIVLEDINASNEGKSNKVEWAVSSGEEHDVFEVERSTTGFDFSKTASVKAENEKTKYTYHDHEPNVGKNYYRLKMINMSGEFSYSKTVIAEMKVEKAMVVRAFPNPVEDQLTITVKGFQTGNATIEIADIRGTIVKTASMPGDKIVIPTHDLAAGIYAVKYANDQTTQVIKIKK